MRGYMIGILDLRATRFGSGFYFDDDGSTRFDTDPDVQVPFYPIRYEGQTPVYAPMRQRIIDHGHDAILCLRCMEPAWHLTRHARERHSDQDVEVIAPLPGNAPPEWFRDEWI